MGKEEEALNLLAIEVYLYGNFSGTFVWDLDLTIERKNDEEEDEDDNDGDDDV